MAKINVPVYIIYSYQTLNTNLHLDEGSP